MHQGQENSVSDFGFILPHIELSSRRKANVNAVDLRLCGQNFKEAIQEPQQNLENP